MRKALVDMANPVIPIDKKTITYVCCAAHANERPKPPFALLVEPNAGIALQQMQYLSATGYKTDAYYVVPTKNGAEAIHLDHLDTGWPDTTAKTLFDLLMATGRMRSQYERAERILAEIRNRKTETA